MIIISSLPDLVLNSRVPRGHYSPNSGQLERCLFTKYKRIPFIPS